MPTVTSANVGGSRSGATDATGTSRSSPPRSTSCMAAVRATIFVIENYWHVVGW
jgi:hypothetical protein